MVVVSRFNFAAASSPKASRVSATCLYSESAIRLSATFLSESVTARRESDTSSPFAFLEKKTYGTSAIIITMAKSIKIRVDFLFTGAKIQIKFEFRQRLTEIITELMILFKHINPLLKAADTIPPEFLQTSHSVYHRAFTARMGL